MTLLSKRLNSSIKNTSFDEKIIGNGKTLGIEKLSSLHITVQDIIKPYYEGKKVWDERSIINRENKIFEEVIQIWALE
jgi:hypothetical protein